MTRTHQAQWWLGANAAITTLAGLYVSLEADTLAGIAFYSAPEWAPTALRISGLISLGLGLMLGILATNSMVTRGQVLFCSALDAGVALSAGAYLVLSSSQLTGTGMGLLLFVSATDAFLAVGQFVSGRRLVPAATKVRFQALGRTLKATATRRVSAPPARVWTVMTDHPGYADVAPNLSKVEVLDGEGLGMVRRCFGPNGENWTETCHLFTPGRAFGFKVHTEAADYPYPIDALTGVWSVAPADRGSVFCIELEAEPKGNALARALFNLAARRQFHSVLVELADAWAARMMEGDNVTRQSTAPASPSVDVGVPSAPKHAASR